jgi:hypothetical protein
MQKNIQAQIEQLITPFLETVISLNKNTIQ